MSVRPSVCISSPLSLKDTCHAYVCSQHIELPVGNKDALSVQRLLHDDARLLGFSRRNLNRCGFSISKECCYDGVGTVGSHTLRLSEANGTSAGQVENVAAGQRRAEPGKFQASGALSWLPQ
eukprot:6186056-Pleurochrysis_carterae.AAC.1